MWDRGRLAALLLLLSCTPEGKDAVVRFTGTPPAGVLFEDTRAVTEVCPACSAPLADGSDRCPCGQKVRRAARAACGFCGGTGKCAVCLPWRPGVCRHCQGPGRLEKEACFNCAGAGACAACSRTSRCDACGGSGELKLPWSRAPVGPQALKVKDGAPYRQSRRLLWLGEELEWPTPASDDPEPSIVVRAEGPVREKAGSISGNPARFRPVRPGSYLVLSPRPAAVFDVLEFTSRMPGVVALGTRLEPAADFVPPLRPGVVRWHVAGPGGTPKSDGPKVALDLPGRYEFRPVVDPAGPAPRAIAVQVLELRVVPPATAYVPAGNPVPFGVRANPPLPQEASVEWSASGPQPIRTTAAGLVFPKAGVYRVQARIGDCASAPTEISVCAVFLRRADDRPASEAVLTALPAGAFDDRQRLRPEAIAGVGERVRIVVEDPSAAPGTSVTVRTKAPDGSELNRPVSYALDRERATRPVLFVADRADEAAEADGRGDDAPEDPTLRAAPQGTVEVFYRGALAATFPVAPSFLHEIPVRFIVVRRPGVPEGVELEHALDRRLREANAVWGPLGRRFTRAKTEVVDPPRNLLLVRGRAAGLDERGQPARVGARVDGADWSVPTAWTSDDGPATPAVTARALAKTRSVDILDRLLASDPEAVILRVWRAGSTPAKVEPLAGVQDVSQSATPLGVGSRAACELSADGTTLTLDEAAILAGCRPRRGDALDLILVGDVRCGTNRRAFRVYSSGAAIVGAWMVDDSGRYPYGLARILGELLLPPGVRPREEDTLFADPLSEAAGVDARKRVGGETARRILERGRGLAGQK